MQQREHILKDIVGIRLAQAIAPWNRVHQPTISIDEVIPSSFACFEAMLNQIFRIPNVRPCLRDGHGQPPMAHAMS
jgi:hypothetical protein